MTSRHAGNSLSQVIRLTNDGLLWATGAVLTNSVPAELDIHHVEWSGLQITPTVGASYTWSVAPILPYASGVITISGRIDPELVITSPLTLTRITRISAASLDWIPMNNTSTRSILVVPGVDIYLPAVVRGQ
jgi:hypothetical protein